MCEHLTTAYDKTDAKTTIDFVGEYTIAAHEFGRQCMKNGTACAIQELANNMARDGYGEASEHRAW